MEAIVTHSDADGIISAALLNRLRISTSIYFSSHYHLIKTLCNLIIKNYKSVKILDISPSTKTLILSSVFDDVLWIDHHQFEVNEIPKNVKIINEKTASTARLIAKILNINDKIVDIADEIDTNNVKTPEADYFRSLISAIKWKFKNYQNVKFKQIINILSFKDFSELEKNELFATTIEEYKKWLTENIANVLSNSKFFEILDKKIVLVESLNGIPVYEIYNKLLEKNNTTNFDILVVVYRRLDKLRKNIITKIEFRSQNSVKVIDIAKKFNGGGHDNAAGCIVERYVTSDEILKKIEEYLKTLNS